MSIYSLNAVDTNNAASRVAQSLAPRANTASTAATSSSSASDAASTADSEGISSSDFLTLLVTEMKNQDPTQPTDPNAYIQQLVGVNSLQQLISINQDLSGLGTSTTSSASTAAVTGS